MSCKTTVPGYDGYIPAFQREYPTGKDVPAYKYEDIDIQPTNLMDGSNYRTNYQASHTSPRNRRNVPNRLPEGSKFHKATAHRAQMVASREAYEYESRPTYWKASYAAQYDGWKAQANAAPSVAAPEFAIGPKHVLTGPDGATSYTRSYGNAGDNPRSKYVYGDGKMVFSRRATSNDLFAGTNKGSVRIPGYSGYVPGSGNNRGTIRENVPHDSKSNLLQIFCQNLPGYTGHRPYSVVNDNGPRNPAGKRDLPPGLHTGLMIDSMRSQ